jgi:hypothetical protein
MAVKYFEYFPVATFNDKLVTDITRRVNIYSSVLSDPYVFLPYTIEEGYRPEDIAQFYYGDVTYVWLVYFSIKAIDPYYDWPLRQREFEKFIVKKYKTKSGESVDTAIVAWTQNTQIDDNVVHYKSVSDDTIISKDSYNLNPLIDGDAWYAVRYYDYENELNENKRIIQLIDKRYAAQAEAELKELLNG